MKRRDFLKLSAAAALTGAAGACGAAPAASASSTPAAPPASSPAEPASSAAPGHEALTQRIESRNGIHTLESAEAIGLGSRAYRLELLDV